MGRMTLAGLHTEPPSQASLVHQARATRSCLRLVVISHHPFLKLSLVVSIYRSLLLSPREFFHKLSITAITTNDEC